MARPRKSAQKVVLAGKSTEKVILPAKNMIIQFVVPLNQMVVRTDDKGRKWWNTPYHVSGIFIGEGETDGVPAFINGSKLSIPAEDQPISEKQKPVSIETEMDPKILGRLFKGNVKVSS